MSNTEQKPINLKDARFITKVPDECEAILGKDTASQIVLIAVHKSGLKEPLIFNFETKTWDKIEI